MGLLMEFFDKGGRAICYTPDRKHLYLWTGEAVGYFWNDHVYAFNGKVLGWFSNGWLYDRQNKPALFSTDATSGPAKPVRYVSPAKSIRSTRPIKSARQAAHYRPAKILSWSQHSGAIYFHQ